MSQQKSGAELIAAERAKVLGRITVEDDVRHYARGRLAQFAALMLFQDQEPLSPTWVRALWLKHDRVERLVIAGAFLAAEIDLLRAGS